MFPLACAASNGHPNVVNALLCHPLIKINKQNKLGLTALMCAAFHGDLLSTQALLSAENIDITILNNKKKSALLLARERGQAIIANLLEEKRATSSWKNKCLFYCDCESEDSQTLHYRTSRIDYIEVSSDQWTSSDDSLNQLIMKFTPKADHSPRYVDKMNKTRAGFSVKSMLESGRFSPWSYLNTESNWSTSNSSRIMDTKRFTLKGTTLKKLMPPLKKKVNKTFDYYENELAESDCEENYTTIPKKSFIEVKKKILR